MCLIMISNNSLWFAIKYTDKSRYAPCLKLICGAVRFPAPYVTLYVLLYFPQLFFRSLQRSNPRIISKQKELSTRARALEMPDDPSDTIPVRWIPDVPEAVSIVLALTPDAVAAKCVETKKTQALPGTRSHGARRRRIGKRNWGPSDYLDIERRRIEGETWPQINSAYGRDVCSQFSRLKQRSKPTNTQNRKRRTTVDFMEMEQRMEKGESWENISAIYGEKARKAYRNWKYRGGPPEHQRQPYAHTTPEQLQRFMT